MNTKYVNGKPFFTNDKQNVCKYSYLSSDIDTDILIIGGGVTGCLLAYYFSTNNIPCTLVEKNIIGYGSTSISTALLQYELDKTINGLSNSSTPKEVIDNYFICKKALDKIDDFIEINGNECNYLKRDTLLYSSNKLDFKDLEYEYIQRKESGLDVYFLDHTQKLFPFSMEAGILSKSLGAELNPYLFSHQLLNSSLNSYLNIYENTEITNLEYLADNVKCSTKYNNTITAKKVIVSTGYDTDLFTNQLLNTKSITYNIVTEPIGDICDYNNYLIRDTNDPYNYYRKTPDNRMIAGGEDMDLLNINYSKDVSEEKFEILKTRLNLLFPNTRNVKIDYKYSGVFASTKDDLGFIGPDKKHENLWYCLGYGANGILYAVYGAQMLIDLYNNKLHSDLHKFYPFRNS